MQRRSFTSLPRFRMTEAPTCDISKNLGSFGWFGEPKVLALAEKLVPDCRRRLGESTARNGRDDAFPKSNRERRLAWTVPSRRRELTISRSVPYISIMSHGALRSAFGDRIQGHARPKTFFQNRPNRMFFDMIDQHALSDRCDCRCTACPESSAYPDTCLPGAACESGSAVRTSIASSRCSMKIVDSFFVFLFSPISPIPSTLGDFEKLGNHRDHFARQFDVLRFLRVDAQPSEMLNAVLTRPVSVRLRSVARK